MGFDRQRKNNSVGAAAATTKCPVQVRILLWGSNKVLALSCDDLPLQCIVGRKTVSPDERSVTAPLSKAASEANSWARATDDTVTTISGSFVGFNC